MQFKNLKHLLFKRIFNMNVIKSIYIPHIERAITAQYIVKAFDKAGIAKVSKIAIEQNRNSCRVYADIDYWHDNEAAYNFIMRLKNPRIEAKFVHNDDNWWVVQANKFPHKTETTRRKGRTVTLFADRERYELEEKMAEKERVKYERQVYNFDETPEEKYFIQHDENDIQDMKRYYEDY